MPLFARIVACTATLFIAKTTSAQAPSSSIQLTMTGGPHAGSWKLTKGSCDALDGQIISMFTPETPPAPGSKVPESIELYTEPGKGKTDGWTVVADFRPTSGRRITYEIYAMPPELQAPGGTKPPMGRGTVAIRKEATGTVATFRGETADGVRMEGSVDCRKK